MPAKRHNISLLLLLIGVLILPAVALAPMARASEAWGDDTLVADTFVIKNDEGTTSGAQRNFFYHNLSVTPPDTVTFRNIASFQDTRTDDEQHKLVVSIGVGESFEEYFSTEYQTPFVWVGIPSIEQEITSDGANPETYLVRTKFQIFKEDPIHGWVEEGDISLGKAAHVYKDDDPIPDP